MLRNFFIYFFCASLFLVSCTSIKSIPEVNINAIVVNELGGESTVDPLVIDVIPDYSSERITLMRSMSVSTDKKGTTGASDSSDCILGLYFGNGLYLDQNDNLVVLVDKYLGITESFRGNTLFKYPVNSSSGFVTKNATRLINYTNDSIKIEDTGGLFKTNYEIKRDAKKATAWGYSVYFEKDKIKLTPSVYIPLYSKMVSWKKIENGWRNQISFFKFNDYLMINNKIIDKEKNFLVENNGSYLRFSYTKNNKYAFRIYRTKSKVLILNEITGAFVTVNVTNENITWKQARRAMFVPENDLQDYSLEITK